MRKSFLKAFGYFACFAWSGMACAVGFGGINVTSSLGQPLVAEIELVAVDKSDKSSLNAHLASPEAFKGAGIDYPYTLPKLKFQLETRANGESYIKATSEQAVNEPFVSLLLELTWSSGRLLREYTFLLDPPGFVAEQPPAAAVKPIEPVIASAVVPAEPVVVAAPLPAAATPAIEAAAAASAPQAAAAPVAESLAASAPQPASPAPVAESVAPEAASAVSAEVAKPVETKVEPLAQEESPVAKAIAKQQAENNHAVASPVTVKRGDTLGKIAKQTKAADVSLERMLVALYRSNAEEFDGHNMNRLRTGKILRLPAPEELANIQQADAVKEIHAQVADWNAYRQKLAAASARAAEQPAKQEVTGKISTSIAEKAPATKESAKEVLKLSKGDAAGDQTAAGGKGKSAHDKALAKEEDAIAKTKALKEAEQRTALLEKNIKDMQRLVELKNQAAAQAVQNKNGAASAPASATSATASSAVAAASAVAQAKPKLKIAGPKVVAPPPSLLDEVLDNPIYLGGGAAALLGLGALGVVLSRRGKKDDKKSKQKKPFRSVVDKENDDASGAGRITAPTQPSPDTGDFTHTVGASGTGDAEEVDPIGEADLFLNFGRDVQAEEVLKEALHKDPSNNPVRLKLLSIYANRKDTKSFYVYAMEIKESRDEAAWSQAAAMGREIDPGNALYSGGTDSAQATKPAAENAALPAVDFDLGFDSAETVNAEPAAMQDVPESEKTAIMSAAEMQSALEAPMDFDVTGTHAGAKDFSIEEPKVEIPAMDFDVTGTSPSFGAPAVEEPALEMAAMDFDITATKASAAATPVSPAPSLNLDDLVFDSTPQAAAPVATPEPDSGMEFTINLPTDIKPAAIPPAPVKDVGLSEISLNLDEVDKPHTAQPSESKDEHWQEVATKLDLAKAYQEMGDQAGAREILEEVVREGDATQRETAQSLLQQMA